MFNYVYSTIMFHSTFCSIIGFLMLLGAALDLHMRWFEPPEKLNGYLKVEGNNHERERTPLLSGGTANESVHVEVQRQDPTKSSKKQGTVYDVRLFVCVFVCLFVC